MNTLRQILTQLGALAIISSAIAWVLKSIFNNYLNKDVEKYKTRISHAAELQVEKFKAQLQIAAQEHDVRFTKLHEKRAEVLSELYSRLEDAHRCLVLLHFQLEHKDALKLEETVTEESARSAVQANLAAFEFFRKHQLYLSKDLANSIKGFVSMVEHASSPFSPDGFEGMEESLTQLFRSKVFESEQHTRYKLQQILERIEEECRLMLGSAGALEQYSSKTLNEP